MEGRKWYAIESEKLRQLSFNNYLFLIYGLMKYKIVAICLSMMLVWWCTLQWQHHEQQPISQVCFEDNCFQVEVADTDSKRQQWLMYRESLPSQSGMLFVFEYSYPHGFWMKNTLIPLDMIWIDEDQKIVDIQTAIPCGADPCTSYVPSWNATYVLEINAWWAEWHDIQSGDKVRFVQ